MGGSGVKKQRLPPGMSWAQLDLISNSMELLASIFRSILITWNPCAEFGWKFYGATWSHRDRAEQQDGTQHALLKDCSPGHGEDCALDFELLQIAGSTGFEANSLKLC